MDLTFDSLNPAWQVLIYLAAFSIVAVASGQIGKHFHRIKLPLITGFLIIGLISGPEMLGLIRQEALIHLRFLNDIALAFIAFAVGSELYLKDLRDRMKSIISMTVSQIIVTFLLIAILVFGLANTIPFMSGLTLSGKIAVSMLAAIIAVLPSPASTIAVISELRARGPFTKTSIGVVVVKDFIVVILFAIIFTLSRALIDPMDFRLILIFFIIAEVILAGALGILVGLLLKWILSIKGTLLLKTVLILLTGFLVYLLTRTVDKMTSEYFLFSFHIEPLLVCIIGSFVVANYTVYKNDFIKIIKDTGPVVYVVFFTLTGALISLKVLASLWLITLIIFAARIITLVIAGYIGSVVAGDPVLFRKISWMPYVTQAGVSVGLAAIIAGEYAGWGQEFAVVMISVIVLNQIFGPPLFRWALHRADEVHVRPDGSSDQERKVIIFGWENQSMALARQLIRNYWTVEFLCLDPSDEILCSDEFKIHVLEGFDHMSLSKVGVATADTLVCMLSDEENMEICQTVNDYFGTSHVIVRLQDRDYYNTFIGLGAMVIDPAIAMVSLLEHLIRAPIATSMLLGMEEVQDSIDIELRNSNYHGLSLRDLRLPADVIILSVTRGEQPIISHGYTRLRLGDIVTLVGSRESLDKVRFNLQGY
ncbi:MAG: cation:proton antiporter [Bacteroidales bacterium]|nr:cation:proton antiporter [Bacteroidales bacterium]